MNTLRLMPSPEAFGTESLVDCMVDGLNALPWLHFSWESVERDDGVRVWLVSSDEGRFSGGIEPDRDGLGWNVMVFGPREVVVRMPSFEAAVGSLWRLLDPLPFHGPLYQSAEQFN